MIVNIRDGEEDDIGVLLCYDDPQFEEEEQEIPFIRWRRYLTVSKHERYIERMKLIVISKGAPETMTGLVNMKKGSDGKSKLRFMSESGDSYNISPKDDTNESIQKQLHSLTDEILIPTWNGTDVALTSAVLDRQNQEISGPAFVKDWIGSLCLSLFHVTKSFIDFISDLENEEEVLQEETSPKGGKKSPKVDEKMFWLWWPITKPRSLNYFLLKMRSQETINLQHFNEQFPLMSGIYRVSIQKEVLDKEPIWTMKIHSLRAFSVQIFFQEPEGNNDKSVYHPDFSDETRIIFNRNFALRYGYAEGINVYGIFGSTAYVTAQLFPYRGDNDYPMMPCLSPFHSLQNFKSLASKITESPNEIVPIITHAKRLRHHLYLIYDDISASAKGFSDS